MNFFKVVSFKEAKDEVKKLIAIPRTETLPLDRALFRRSAKTLYSPEELPSYNRSTVDGYAVCAKSVYGASESVPAMLKLGGSVRMGEKPDFQLKEGEAVYVPTGGALPEGADAVIMLEHTEKFGDEIAIFRPVSVRDNVVRIGDDCGAGSVLVNKFKKITPLNVGLLAALGISELEVLKPLAFAIVSTGDEIIEITRKPQNCEMRDVNTHLTRALCESYGYRVIYERLARDCESELECAIREASKIADVILVSGGSSVGAKDYTERVFEKLGKLLIHGVAMKPGKPTLLANVNGKLAAGLPGHPLACLMTLKLLILDAVAETYGDAEPPFVYARAALNFPSSPGRTTIVPLALESGEKEAEATPLFTKSGLISVISRADAYAILPDNLEGVAKGDTIKAYLLK